MTKTSVDSLLKGKDLQQTVTINGWVRTFRSNRFIALNDGSTINNIQCVLDFENFDEATIKRITTGAAICVTGLLIESLGKGQKFEIQVSELTILGNSNPETYPIQPKKHSLEFLRENAHLRIRTNTFSAVMRVRSALAFAVHQYFTQNGFYYFNAPIITGSDAEGAGEMFRVSNLDGKNPPLDADKNIDYNKDFFGKQTNLTVSGQQDFIQYTIKYVLENCKDDLAFLDQRLMQEEKSKPQNQRSDMSLLEKLSFVVENNFKRVSYTEAIDILKNSKPNKKKKFQFPINEWGIDLQSEHERFLVEKHFKCPVILFDYPANIKAFYMRLNDDGKTVRAMDVLFPGIGEIVGGSQREERLDVLQQKIKTLGIDEKELWWYLDLRKFGSCVHSGFGLGFERLVQFTTGMTNIRDVIPYPRFPQSAEF